MVKILYQCAKRSEGHFKNMRVIPDCDPKTLWFGRLIGTGWGILRVAHYYSKWRNVQRLTRVQDLKLYSIGFPCTLPTNRPIPRIRECSRSGASLVRYQGILGKNLVVSDAMVDCDHPKFSRDFTLLSTQQYSLPKRNKKSRDGNFSSETGDIRETKLLTGRRKRIRTTDLRTTLVTKRRNKHMYSMKVTRTAMNSKILWPSQGYLLPLRYDQ